MRKTISALTVLFAAGLAFGEYDTSGHITMERSDSVSGTAHTPTLETSSFCSTGQWSNAKAPSSEYKYFVSKYRSLYTPWQDDLSWTFKGAELAVAGTIGTTASRVEMTVPRLVLLGGAIITVGAKRPYFYGKTYLYDSSAANPVIFKTSTVCGTGFEQAHYVIEHAADMYGDSEQAVTMQFNAGYYGNFACTGSHSEFYGTYILPSCTSLCLGDGNMRGTVKVASGALLRTWFYRERKTTSAATIKTYDPIVANVDVAAGGMIEVSAGNTLTVANLHLGDGAKLSFLSDGDTCGKIVVTGKFTTDGTVYVSSGTSSGLIFGAPPSYDVITLASDEIGKLDPDIFEVGNAGASSIGPLPHISLQVVSGEARSMSLRISQREIVTLVTSQDYGEATYSPLICALNANGVAYWSDGKAPTAGKDYYVGKGYYMNMPLCEEMIDFKGDSLTLDNGAYISSGSKTYCAGFNVAEFGLSGAGFVRTWAGNTLSDAYGLTTMCIGGDKLYVTSTSGGKFEPYGNKMLRVNSNLVGGGPLKVTSLEYANNDGPRGTVELKGDNSEWSGKLTVTLASNTKDRPSSEWGNTVPNEGVFVRLIAGGDTSLGGPMSAFTADGVLVEQRSQLRITKDTELDALNRGVTFKGLSTVGPARLLIDPDCTFSIMNKVALYGTLRLEGDGILGLGNEITVSSTPIVDVQSGGLKPMHTNALNGAQINLDVDGLRFIFDVEPEAEGMQEFGLVNVKASKPFVYSALAKTVNVEFDFGGGPEGAPDSNYDLALFTLKTEALVNDLSGRISMPSSCTRNTIEKKIRKNADGTYTIYAHFGVKASTLIIYH